MYLAQLSSRGEGSVQRADRIDTSLVIPRLVLAGWFGVPGNEAIEGVWDTVPGRLEPALGSFALSFHRTASTTQSTLRSIN